jgi:hypothetical protein
MKSFIFKHDCHLNPKNGLTYGKFYGIEKLIKHFKIKDTNAINKLLKLNLKCSMLKQFFTDTELEEIDPLLHYLLYKQSKNTSRTFSMSVFDRLREHNMKKIIRKSVVEKQNMKVVDENSTRQGESNHNSDYSKCSSTINRTKTKQKALDLKILRLGQLTSIEKRDLSRYMMYLA